MRLTRREPLRRRTAAKLARMSSASPTVTVTNVPSGRLAPSASSILPSFTMPLNARIVLLLGPAFGVLAHPTAPGTAPQGGGCTGPYGPHVPGAGGGEGQQQADGHAGVAVKAQRFGQAGHQRQAERHCG